MAKCLNVFKLCLSLGAVIQGIVQAYGSSIQHDRPYENNNTYVFDPKHLEELSAQAQTTVASLSLENHPTNAYDFYKLSEDSSPDQVSIIEAYKTERILEEYERLLHHSYPNKLLTDSKWVWNNVGGITARVKVLYCTTKEYLVLFGTQTAQEGFSGRYQSMDVWDVMLTGKMRSFNAEPTQSFPLFYGSRSVSYLPRGEARVYEMEEYTYMADYGRGNISRAFWSGIIAPYLFVNHDYVSMSQQIGDCIRSWWQQPW